MNYKLRFKKTALQQLKKLDFDTRKKIYDYLLTHVDGSTNPRLKGKALTGNLVGSWRYRIGKYRVICEIQDNELLVVAVKIGHRSRIYQ